MTPEIAAFIMFVMGVAAGWWLRSLHQLDLDMQAKRSREKETP